MNRVWPILSLAAVLGALVMLGTHPVRLISAGGNPANSPAQTPRSARNERVIYVDGTANANLTSAVAACGDTAPCWIVDSVPERFTSSPFAGYSGPGMQINLGPGEWTTDVPLILPNKTQLIGSGRAGHGDVSGTRIQATASFPPATAVVLLGPPGTDFAVRAENLTIDCNNARNGIGVENASAEEQSGLNHVLVVGCASKAIYWHGNNAQNSGMSDVEVLYTGTTATAATVGIEVDNVPSFRGVHGATVNATGQATQPSVDVIANSPGTYTDISVENSVVGVDVRAPNVQLQNIQGNTRNSRILVRVEKGVQGLIATTLCCAAANVLVNADNGKTFAQAEFPMYMYGIGATPSEMYFGMDHTNAGHLQADSVSVAPVSVGMLPPAGAHPGMIQTVNDSAPLAAEGQKCVGGNATPPNVAIAISNGAAWKCF